MNVVPFSLLPPKSLYEASKPLVGTGEFICAFFPFLRDTLRQAEMTVSPRDYVAAALFVAITDSWLFAAFFVLIAVLSKDYGLLYVAAGAGLAVLCAVFLTILIYPGITSAQRERKLNQHLIPATRQLLIEVKSGVPLFNAMASISDDYGEVSKEFSKVVRRISGGTPEIDALSEATLTNPSEQLKKVLWQISNALKVGSDVSRVLDTQIVELMRLRIEQIRRYGQELSPWTMLYMMAAVVLPSMGIAMLIVISGFAGISLPKIVLPAIAAFLLGFQIFFMNFVASRRPAI